MITDVIGNAQPNNNNGDAISLKNHLSISSGISLHATCQVSLFKTMLFLELISLQQTELLVQFIMSSKDELLLFIKQLHYCLSSSK